MVNYAQYLTAAQSPADALMRGYGQGLQVQQQQQKLAANQQKMQMAQQQQNRMLQEQQNFSDFVRGGRHSIDEYMQFSADNPSMQKQAMNAFKVRKQSDQDQLMRDGTQWFSALKNDRPDLVIDQAREKAAALEEAGNSKDAEFYNQIADYAEQNPKIAEDYLGQNLAFVDPNFARMAKGAPTTGQERIIQNLQEEATAAGKPITTQEALMQLRGFTSDRIRFEQQKAAATQTGKSQVDLTYKPQIEQGIQEVKTDSKKLQGLDTQINAATGELVEFESKFPSLVENLGQLEELVGQLPFGVAEETAQSIAKAAGYETESMVAESKFNAIIDNQILPLLKQTFGAAFTEKEGDKLRKTIEGDGGPKAKLATIKAFINQKVKDIESKSLELEKLRGERDNLASPQSRSDSQEEAKKPQKRLRFNPQTGDFE